MKVLLPTFILALWSLHVWVFDPLHIEDRIVTDEGAFFYWLLGAIVSIFLGLILAFILEDTKRGSS